MINKLMIFGDSIFKGVTYSEEKNRYIICEHDYINKLKEKGVETVNHSKMGATVDKITEMINRYMPEINPDTAILFGFGGNDCDHNWQEVSDDPLPVSKNSAKVVPDEFEEKYKMLIKSVRRTGAEILIANLIPLDIDKFMNYITANRSRENILSFLGDTSMVYRWQEQYSRIVESVAISAGCPLVDVRKSFLFAHKYKELIASDGIHPTPTGHKLVSNAVWNFLKDIGVKKLYA